MWFLLCLSLIFVIGGVPALLSGAAGGAVGLIIGAVLGAIACVIRLAWFIFVVKSEEREMRRQ